MEKELKLTTQYGEQKVVQLEISRYISNNCIYIGYTNDMPELEEFLVQNGIGTFTGLTQNSGYCTYPLYSFDAETLRKLCPKGMAEYERSLQKGEKIIVEKGWSR